jgi:hypothetical protein
MRFWKKTSDEDTYSPAYPADDRDAGSAQWSWLKPAASATIIVLAMVPLVSGITGGSAGPAADNLCPAGKVPGKHVVVSVDKTDDFTDDQQRALETSLRAHVRTLAVGERLTIFLMTPKGKELNKVLFDRCRPKTQQEADALTQNPVRIGVAYQERFLQPFEQALTDLKSSQRSDYSPIIESLYGIAHSAPLADPAGRRVLELWTDLLNNSSTLNQFQRGYRFEDLLRVQSTYLDLPALAGAEVTVHQLVNRNDAHHTPEHARFWREYLAHAKIGEKQLAIQRL